MKSAAYIERLNRPLRTYAILFLAFLYVPVLFLPLFSFNDSLYIAFPLKAFTTKWYAQMLATEPMHAALMNSLRVGVATAVFATILGVFGAKDLDQVLQIVPTAANFWSWDHDIPRSP